MVILSNWSRSRATAATNSARNTMIFFPFLSNPGPVGLLVSLLFHGGFLLLLSPPPSGPGGGGRGEGRGRRVPPALRRIHVHPMKKNISAGGRRNALCRPLVQYFFMLVLLGLYTISLFCWSSCLKSNEKIYYILFHLFLVEDSMLRIFFL